MPLDDDDVTTANKLTADIQIPVINKTCKVWHLIAGALLVVVLIGWIFL